MSRSTSLPAPAPSLPANKSSPSPPAADTLCGVGMLFWFAKIATMTTRRDFLAIGALSATALGFTTRDAFADTAEQVKQMKPPAKPIIVTRVTGDQSIQEAYQMLLDGGDTLEAA